MNTEKESEIVQELDAGSRGESTNRHSHYLQGTYFRTWAYGEGRNGFETRDPHMEVGVLKRELRRMTQGLEQGFDGYKKFKDVKVLDETADFAKFSEPVQSMLAGIKKQQSTGSIFKKRYALPMRDYEGFYPKALNLQGDAAKTFVPKVRTARTAYVQDLERIVADSSADGYVRRDRVHVAIAKFAHDSGIYTALDSHFASMAR